MNIFITLLAILIALVSPGCGKAGKGEAVLATIGKTKITVEGFNERINNLPERYRDIIRKKKKEYLEELINDTLLYREAVDKKLLKDKDVQKVIEEAKKKILIARLLKDEVDDTLTISEDDIVRFYEENKQNYMTPEIMRVSHILVPSREDAGKILAEIRNGADFEDMARAKSVDPTAQNGGNIGYFPKGQLMPEFEDACSRLGIGEVSGIVETKLGYHIIKLTDRRLPELRPMETVRDDISSRLRVIKRRTIFNGLLDKLRKKTDIKIDEKVLTASEEEGGAAKGVSSGDGSR
ncbi:MAG: peptidylprolyl isomerase [Candidatus Omnitrophota bacterium]